MMRRGGREGELGPRKREDEDVIESGVGAKSVKILDTGMDDSQKKKYKEYIFSFPFYYFLF